MWLSCDLISDSSPTGSLTRSLTQVSLQNVLSKLHMLHYPEYTLNQSSYCPTGSRQIGSEGLQRWSRISATFSMLIAILLLSGDPVWDGGDMWTALLSTCSVTRGELKPEQEATPFLPFHLLSQTKSYCIAAIGAELVLIIAVGWDNHKLQVISQTCRITFKRNNNPDLVYRFYVLK